MNVWHKGRVGILSLAVVYAVILCLCAPFLFLRMIIRWFRCKGLRVLVMAVSLVIVAIVFCLCMQYSLVLIDDGGEWIIVKWIDIPYEKHESLVDRIVEKFLSPEARAFRAMVHTYSKESLEIDFSSMGMVSLYSVFAHDRYGFTDTRGIWVSLRTGQMLSTSVDGEFKPVELDACDVWDGVTTRCWKVTVQEHQREHGYLSKQFSVKQCSIKDCQYLKLGKDDVLAVFNPRGLFVRVPWGFAFRGYRWEND